MSRDKIVHATENFCLPPDDADKKRLEGLLRSLEEKFANNLLSLEFIAASKRVKLHKLEGEIEKSYITLVLSLCSFKPSYQEAISGSSELKTWVNTLEFFIQYSYFVDKCSFFDRLNHGSKVGTTLQILSQSLQHAILNSCEVTDVHKAFAKMYVIYLSSVVVSVPSNLEGVIKKFTDIDIPQQRNNAKKALDAITQKYCLHVSTSECVAVGVSSANAAALFSSKASPSSAAVKCKSDTENYTPT